jgi:hypothetical protein
MTVRSPNPQLIVEDAASLREAMRCMVRYASDATGALDTRIEDEDLDGKRKAEELREALERVQNLSLDISEQLDTYQDRRAC